MYWYKGDALIKLQKLTTNSESWVFSIAYGVLAFLVNYYASVQVYGNLTIHLGLVFVLMCLITRGVSPALFSYLFCSLGLYSATGSLTLVALTLVELLVLILLYRKGVLLLFADILFWLVIGIPVTYLFVQLLYDIESTDFTQIILIKQALNGLLSVSIATMLRALIPYKWYYSNDGVAPPKLSKRILELCLVSLAIPSLIMMLLLSNRSADTLERKLIQELETRSEHLRDRVDNYIQLHLTALGSLTEVLRDDPNALYSQELMALWMERYPGFLTMIRTDNDGIVISGSPADKFNALLSMPKEERDVSDRDYFIVAKKGEKSYVSNVFRGRGFGRDPIIALSIPLIQGKQFKGIVEGSLSLPKFDSMDDIGEGRLLLVVDTEGHLIYASKALKLKPLDDIDITDINSQYSNRVKSLRLNGSTVFNYESVKTDNGWRVYVLSETDELLVEYRNSFYVLFVTLLLISVVASRVAHYFTLNITRPLERLIASFSAQKEIKLSRKYFHSQEIESVERQLQKTQHVMLDFQEELKSQVANKTKELYELNEELERLSSHDPLTGILNRRGFEQVIETVYPLACRNKTTITLAIMDLDHFKKVNDICGHTAGDYCLVSVGETIQNVFQRDSDYVARFGGEEFVALIIGGKREQHIELLEALRKKIENEPVQFEGNRIELTISIGAYSLVNSFKPTYEDLISLADKLLYQSKHEGRNRLTAQFE